MLSVTGATLSVTFVVVVDSPGGGHPQHAGRSGAVARVSPRAPSPPPISLTRTLGAGKESIVWRATAPEIPLVGFALRRPASGWTQLAVLRTSEARAALGTLDRHSAVILVAGCWEYGRPAHELSSGRTIAALAAFRGTPAWLNAVAREELGVASAVACAGKPAQPTVSRATAPVTPYVRSSPDFAGGTRGDLTHQRLTAPATGSSGLATVHKKETEQDQGRSGEIQN